MDAEMDKHKMILDITINGLPIAEIPDYMQRSMTDEEFEDFMKPDDHEMSIEEVVIALKSLNDL